MDRKTLEYLEERSKKGRAIVKKIETLEKFLAQVKGEDFKTIKLAFGSNTLEITKWGSKQVELDYYSITEAHMLNAFITITQAEIYLLQVELDEL